MHDMIKSEPEIYCNKISYKGKKNLKREKTHTWRMGQGGREIKQKRES